MGDIFIEGRCLLGGMELLSGVDVFSGRSNIRNLVFDAKHEYRSPMAFEFLILSSFCEFSIGGVLSLSRFGTSCFCWAIQADEPTTTMQP